MVQQKLHGTFSKKEFGHLHNLVVARVEVGDVLGFGKHGVFWNHGRAIMLKRVDVSAVPWMPIPGMWQPSRLGQ